MRNVVAFAPFTLDRERRQLLRGGSPVPLTPKALLLLETLLLARPRALSKEELTGRIWEGAYIGDASLSVTVAALRRALGDDARRPRYVRTVHGFGYAWCGDACEKPEPSAPAAALVCSLRWHQREIPLAAGENLLGRDHSACVVIDDPAVSRRHAHVLVDGAAARLSDLGSKNGTLHNGQQLEGPVALAPGDEIGIGPVTLRFELGRGQESTLTRRA